MLRTIINKLDILCSSKLRYASIDTVSKAYCEDHIVKKTYGQQALLALCIPYPNLELSLSLSLSLYIYIYIYNNECWVFYIERGANSCEHIFLDLESFNYVSHD